MVKKAWTHDVFDHKGDNWQFPPEGGSGGHPAYAKFGKVDILVNNAGMSPLYKKLSDVTEDMFDKVVGVKGQRSEGRRQPVAQRALPA